MRRAAQVTIVMLALVVSARFGVSAALHPNPKTPAGQQELIRTQITDILSAPEYNRKFRPRSKDRIGEFISRMIGQFADWLASGLEGKGVGRTISKLLAVAVIAAFLGLCVVLLLRLSARLHHGRGPEESELPEDYDLPSSNRLMAEAARLAGDGDYHGAFLRAYLGSISYLDEVHALRFERSRTNWEYMRELASRGHDSLAAQLRPLTSDFDRKLYGHDHCTRQDYDRAVQAYEQVRQMAA